MHWWQHVLGLDNGAGGWYLFWSGFGANFQELAILGGIIAVYRKHSCHAQRCYRIGKHPVAGTPYVVCRKHHPTINDAAPTASDIAIAHAAAQGDWPS